MHRTTLLAILILLSQPVIANNQPSNNELYTLCQQASLPSIKKNTAKQNATIHFPPFPSNKYSITHQQQANKKVISLPIEFTIDKKVLAFRLQCEYFIESNSLTHSTGLISEKDYAKQNNKATKTKTVKEDSGDMIAIIGLIIIALLIWLAIWVSKKVIKRIKKTDIVQGFVKGWQAEEAYNQKFKEIQEIDEEEFDLASEQYSNKNIIESDAIEEAISMGDWDRARMSLQKIAYGMVDKTVSKENKNLFKQYMTSFAKRDPLYQEIIPQIKGVVGAHKGILQSKIYPHLPNYSTETIRYILYFANEIGDIMRVKKGRSYELYLIGTTLEGEIV